MQFFSCQSWPLRDKLFQTWSYLYHHRILAYWNSVKSANSLDLNIFRVGTPLSAFEMQKKKNRPQISIVNVYVLTFCSSSGHECYFSLSASSQGMQIFNLVSYYNLFFSSFSFFLLSILNWLKNHAATIIVSCPALNLLMFYLWICQVTLWPSVHDFCIFSFV